MNSLRKYQRYFNNTLEMVKKCRTLSEENGEVYFFSNISETEKNLWIYGNKGEICFVPFNETLFYLHLEKVVLFELKKKCFSPSTVYFKKKF